MKVRQIKWLSYESQEAELEIESENLLFVAFMHPCTLGVGEEIPSLSTLFARDVEVVNDAHSEFIKNTNGFECYCIGKLIDKENRLLEVFGKKIEIDEDLPSDAQAGLFYSFSCDRLDIESVGCAPRTSR